MIQSVFENLNWEIMKPLRTIHQSFPCFSTMSLKKLEEGLLVAHLYGNILVGDFISLFKHRQVLDKLKAININ